MRTSNKEHPTLPIKRTPESLVREARITTTPTLSPSVQKCRMLMPRGFGKTKLYESSKLYESLFNYLQNLQSGISKEIAKNSGLWRWKYRMSDDFEDEKVSEWIGDDLSNVVEFLEDGFTVTLK